MKLVFLFTMQAGFADSSVVAATGFAAATGFDIAALVGVFFNWLLVFGVLISIISAKCSSDFTCFPYVDVPSSLSPLHRPCTCKGVELCLSFLILTTGPSSLFTLNRFSLGVVAL